MAYLGTLGTLAVIYLFYMLAKLSERLGSVERMAPLYRYYYVAACLVAVGLVTQVVIAGASATPNSSPNWLFAAWFVLLMYYLPLTVGVTIGLVVSWRYWSWLIVHQDK